MTVKFKEVGDSPIVLECDSSEMLDIEISEFLRQRLNIHIYHFYPTFKKLSSIELYLLVEFD